MLTPADITQTFNDPATAHAAVVHAPIVLTGVAAFVAVVAAFVARKRPAWRWAALLTCAVAAASAWGAKITGESAFDAMGDPPTVARQIAHEHEALAEQMTLISTAATLVALGAWAPKRPLRTVAAWGTALVSSVAAFWAVSAAHHGGQLVYEYGVGTPKPITPFDLEPADDAPPHDPRLVFYRESVYPILSDRCFGCHGSGERPAARLSLTTPRTLLAGGRSGSAIVPGDPDASLLMQTISGSHPSITMPPGDDNVLSATEIETVRQWIADGAVWAPPD